MSVTVASICYSRRTAEFIRIRVFAHAHGEDGIFDVWKNLFVNQLIY